MYIYFFILDLPWNSVWRQLAEAKAVDVCCARRDREIPRASLCWRRGDPSVNEQIGKHKERFSSCGFILV